MSEATSTAHVRTPRPLPPLLLIVLAVAAKRRTFGPFQPADLVGDDWPRLPPGSAPTRRQRQREDSMRLILRALQNRGLTRGDTRRGRESNEDPCHYEFLAGPPRWWLSAEGKTLAKKLLRKKTLRGLVVVV